MVQGPCGGVREGNQPHAPLPPTRCLLQLPLLSPVTQGKGNHRTGFQDFRESPPHPSGLQCHEGRRPPGPLTEPWDIRAKRHLYDPPSLILPGRKQPQGGDETCSRLPRGAAKEGQVSLTHPRMAAPETAVLKGGDRLLGAAEGVSQCEGCLRCPLPGVPVQDPA